MKNLWLKATLICGAFDVIYASVWTTLAGGTIAKTWQYVASGPLGDGARNWGSAGVLAGLIVHFAIMAVMVGFLLRFANARWLANINAWVVGTVYGIGLYLVMNAVVVPVRFGTQFPPANLMQGLIGLIPHIILVGIPTALMARRRGAA